ncbi:hypothetical protein UlMin_017119 [Ulmus minor]
MAKYSRFLIVVLRLLALAATVVAIVLMVTSHDSSKVFNLTFKAKYNNTPAFKYFVIAKAIAGGLTFVSLFLMCFKSFRSRLVIFLDVVIALVLCSGISAALAVAEVGKNGNSHAGWLPICGQVPKFCDQVTGSLIAGFVAAILYLLLILYSLYVVLDPIFPVN